MPGPKPWNAGRAFTCCGRRCNEGAIYRTPRRGLGGRDRDNFFAERSIDPSFLLRKVINNDIIIGDIILRADQGAVSIGIARAPEGG